MSGAVGKHDILLSSNSETCVRDSIRGLKDFQSKAVGKLKYSLFLED